MYKYFNLFVTFKNVHLLKSVLCNFREVDLSSELRGSHTSVLCIIIEKKEETIILHCFSRLMYLNSFIS